MSGPSLFAPGPGARPPRPTPIPSRNEPVQAPPAGFHLARGARVLPDGTVEFSVWAPGQARLGLRLLEPDGRSLDLDMERTGDGVFVCQTDGARAGSDYLYVLDDGTARPDPVSRHQPHGVHGASRVVDPSFPWRDQAWTGLDLPDLVFYELHVGTFTAAGTFDGVVDRLGYLADLGVNTLELMPVGAFPGARNWGYDGAHLYAPHDAYGGPEGLKRLVDAAHAHGLAVVLDVVYNHVGPEGNYLGAFGPYFTDRYRTPWGQALNFDGAGSDEVRRYFIDNALYWLTEYHLDGLRLDAIHGIFDFGARHILSELAEAFHAEVARRKRRAWLIAESDLNDARVVQPASAGGWGLDAQWSDDLHHALHVTTAGNRRGYFEDFRGVAEVGKALAAGFVYDGVYSPHRGRRHGNSAAGVPGERFVVFSQNHDQIANGAQGQRLAAWAGPELERAAATILFAAPYLPLLFMGQEYAEPNPFVYFTSHGDPDLARAVREGRRREFLAFFAGAPTDEDFPDPQSQDSFLRSKLGWQLDREPHASTLAFYKRLIQLRRQVPALQRCRRDLTQVAADPVRRCLAMVRGDPDGGTAVCAANLSDEVQTIEAPATSPAGWSLALSSDGEHGAVADTVAGPGMQVTVPPRTAVIYLQRPA